MVSAASAMTRMMTVSMSMVMITAATFFHNNHAFFNIKRLRFRSGVYLQVETHIWFRPAVNLQPCLCRGRSRCSWRCWNAVCIISSSVRRIVIIGMLGCNPQFHARRIGIDEITCGPIMGNRFPVITIPNKINTCRRIVIDILSRVVIIPVFFRWMRWVRIQITCHT